VSAPTIGIDYKLKLCHRFQFDLVIFDLLCGAGWAEGPLLAYDSAVRLTRGGVAQHKLLFAFRFALDKMQKYPPDVLRPIEAQGNGLRPGTGGAPPTLIALWARA
jgi:hypothetical protein